MRKAEVNAPCIFRFWFCKDANFFLKGKMGTTEVGHAWSILRNNLEETRLPTRVRKADFLSHEKDCLWCPREAWGKFKMLELETLTLTLTLDAQVQQDQPCKTVCFSTHLHCPLSQIPQKNWNSTYREREYVE